MNNKRYADLIPYSPEMIQTIRDFYRSRDWTDMEDFLLEDLDNENEMYRYLALNNHCFIMLEELSK